MAVLTLINETELLARVAAGDEQAFKKIYDTYFSRIYAFANHVLHSKALSEEVVQEVMLKIWQMGQQLAEIENLEGYLKMLAKRKAIDTLRRQAAERKVEGKLRVSWREGHEETESAIDLNETRRILQHGISLLPSQQRTVYQLCHEQGLKYEQAAEQLNIAPGTVHRHMKLALKFLRAYLREHSDVAVYLVIFGLFRK